MKMDILPDVPMLDAAQASAMLQRHMPDRNAAEWLANDRRCDPLIPAFGIEGSYFYREQDLIDFIYRISKSPQVRRNKERREGNERRAGQERRQVSDRRHRQIGDQVRMDLERRAKFRHDRRNDLDRRLWGGLDRRSGADRRAVPLATGTTMERAGQT